MSDEEFRIFMDLLIVSDPWPLEYGKDQMNDLADSLARDRGYDNWIVAYHSIPHYAPQTP